MSDTSNDFAKLFEASLNNLNTELYEGKKVTGTVISITNDNVFVDLGGRSEGIMDRKDLVNANGELKVKEGDKITAICMGLQNGITKLAMKVGTYEIDSAVQDAYEAKIPIEGKVIDERKGGFGVQVGSSNAFCPFSGMDLRGVKKEAAEYIGQTYQFLITEYSEEGRNIILSRRRLLEEEATKMRDYLKGMLAVGDIRDGKVVNIQAFGAFVDLGGIEGLVPASEIGWTRGVKVEDVLAIGQPVQVKIIGLDWGEDSADGKKKERITLSIKQAVKSPWERIEEGTSMYEVGKKLTGKKVVRIADFGAFIELEAGVDGLAHISQLGQEERVEKVSDVLKEGDIVDVTILGIDVDKRRISLCIGDPKVKDEAPVELSHEQEVELASASMGERLMGEVESLKPFGAFIKLPNGQTGLLHISQMGIEENGPARSREMNKRFPLHAQVEVIVKEINGNRVSLTLPEIVEQEIEKNTVNDYKDEGSVGFGNLDDVFGKLNF